MDVATGGSPVACSAQARLHMMPETGVTPCHLPLTKLALAFSRLLANMPNRPRFQAGQAEPLMRVRVIDLDGSITAQERVLRTFRPAVYDLRRWAPRVRLACRWKRFYRFERSLDRLFGATDYLEPWINLLGSG